MFLLLLSKAIAMDWVQKLDIKVSQILAPVETLPGGNQQKDVVAKELNTEPKLMISSELPQIMAMADRIFVIHEGRITAEVPRSEFTQETGHQMQINAVNREKLLDAKAHPERHRNLIVRVWGWSGYFAELDECYQNHIIKRMELAV